MLETIELTSTISRIKAYLTGLQQRIGQVIEAEDGKAVFIENSWEHQSGGGGVTCVLTDGKHIEKAGVNFSHIQGNNLPPSATAKRPHLANCGFQALGLSVVIHPRNPYVPTSHANIRFIVVEDEAPYWWFGGGFDLTPYYGFTEDCEHWHQTAKAACEPFGDDIYPRFKQWCDQYFFLTHRNEPRGIGGLFFDDLNQWGFERSFHFMQSIGNHYLQAYQPILTRRKHHLYGEKERAFQCYRRGRYVEFNLLYDRGTLFGLQSGGRTESILMSLPPLAAWQHNWQPELASEEAKLYSEFLIARNWIK